jgi:hypothetical protein
MNRKALLGKALLEVVAEFAVFATLLFVAAGTLLCPPDGRSWRSSSASRW